MGITNIVTNFFELYHIPYTIIDSPSTGADHSSWITHAIKIESLATIALLYDAQGITIALYPSNKHLNLAALITILQKPLRFLDLSELSEIANHCINKNVTSFMAKKNFQLVVDNELSDNDQIHFEATNAQQYIQIETMDLQAILEQLPLGCHFSEPRIELDHQAILTSGTPRLDISNKIKKIQNLPVLPMIASELLQLQNNPDTTVEELTTIIQKDPSITAQIIRYSNSALFNQSNSVHSLYDAVFRILGFETVLFLAIGLSMGKIFTLDKKGPLGATQLWMHATYNAAICESLAAKLPKDFRPSPGQAYLAGLLHDIGYLVLAHSFASEYFWLNKLIASKPDISACVIEQQLLGVSHTDLGLALIENWKMPDFLKVVVLQHHNENYLQQHCEITGLVLIADRVLSSRAMSDSNSQQLPFDLMHKLGLNENIINEAVDKVFDNSESLDSLVQSISR